MKKFLIYLVLFLNLGAIIYLWLNGTSHYLLTAGTLNGQMIAFGRLAGLMAEFFILLQLVLIGRVTFIEQVFGHDRLNRIHRWVGYSIVLLFFTHPLLLTFGYSQISEISFMAQFYNFLTTWEDVFKALLALLLFCGIITMSVVIVKKRLRYETWYFTHLLMYLAIVLAFDHQTSSGDMASGLALHYWIILNFAVFGLILLCRWLAPFYRFFLHRFYVEKVVMEAPDIFSVYLKGKNLGQYKFHPGQFANLTFLQKGMWFTHPFSFSSAPNGNFLRFSIKTSGDFTDKIGQIKPNTKVIIDGPLGIFTLNSAKKNKFLFLAGGIGITPLLALAEQLNEQKADVILLYGCKTEKDTAFKQELSALNLKQYIILSQESPLVEDFLSGRITGEKIKKLVPDFLEREVYLCGPEAMMKAVLADLKTLGFPKQQIHFEKFDY